MSKVLENLSGPAGISMNFVQNNGLKVECCCIYPPSNGGCQLRFGGVHSGGSGFGMCCSSIYVRNTAQKDKKKKTNSWRLRHSGICQAASLRFPRGPA